MADGSPGYVRRRIRPETPFDLFLAVSRPGRQRMLVLNVGGERFPAGPLLQARGVEAIALPAESPNSEPAVQVRLVDPAYEGVFATLVADVIEAVTASASATAAAHALLARLRRWQGFLEHGNPEGLGPETRQGLYGELYVLRGHAIPALGARASVMGWIGPDRAEHDFRFGPIAIEAKTTTARQHPTIQITGERQLDDHGLRALLLWYLQLDALPKTGETLPQAVTAVRNLASSDPIALEELEDRLHRAGYLDAHADRYAGIGYRVRAVRCFRVGPGFPRITPGDLPDGVGGVCYSVAVAACTPFALPVEDVTAFIREYASAG